MSALRPFFGFYGAKWRDTPKLYPPPVHDTVIEPFAGSAGYSVRHFEKRVVLVEKDPVIAGVWDYLIHTPASEIRVLPDLAEGQTVDDLALCQEARWLIGLWLNRAVSRPRKSPSAWMRGGLRPGSFWGDRVRSTVAAQVDQIRHWHVFNLSYEEVPWSGPATWFIDPPYQAQGRHYAHGSKGIDFAQLAEWCKGRQGQAIVCEQEGADWLPFQPLASTKTTRASRSAEAVWLSSEGIAA